MSKNSKNGLFLIVAVLLCMSLLVSACSSKSNSSDKATASNSAQATQEAGASSAPAAEQPTETPKPDYTVTAARFILPYVTFPEGDDWDNNTFYRGYKEEFGFTLTNKLAVPYDEYAQKLNVMIASGDLPDLSWVDQTQLKQLVEADMIADLSDAYDQYISDLAKEKLEPYESLMNASRFDGKLMAIPMASSTIDSAQVLWVRTDWLKKLNLPEPKTLQDVLKIAEAFATQDPDGNGKADTYGLALQKDLWRDPTGLEGFFNGYHAYPNTWVNKGDRLEAGIIQPEMKPALEQLQKMYAAKQIDPEFAVKSFQQMGEEFAANKIGIYYGGQGTIISPVQSAKDQNPDMDWQAYPILSIDDRPALVQNPFGGSLYFVVRKGFEHPEALIQIVNFQLDKGWGPEQEYEKYFAPADGSQGYFLSYTYIYPAGKNQLAATKAAEALETDDTSNMNKEELGVYEKVKAYVDGDNKMWGQYRDFGPGGAQSILIQYVEQNTIHQEQFFGPPTDGMGKYNGSLKTLIDTEITKIIMGESPIDAFDKLVSDWKKLGGDQITKEVNEWYAAQK